MRFAGNFHPEWGYLAPAPTFMRTARVVLLATAIGASAGAVVVLSLMDRSSETSVAARTLVRPVAAAASTLPAASHSSLTQPPQTQATKLEMNSAPAAIPGASASSAASPAKPPTSVAALAEAPAAPDVSAAAPAAQIATIPKKAKNRRHTSSHYASRGRHIVLLPGDYSDGLGAPYRGRWGGYYAEDGYGYSIR